MQCSDTIERISGLVEDDWLKNAMSTQQKEPDENPPEATSIQPKATSTQPAPLSGEMSMPHSATVAKVKAVKEYDPTLDELADKWLPKQQASCDICNKLYVNRSKMLWHRRIHDKNRPRYTCPVRECAREYASKQSCDLHYRQTHLGTGFLCPVCQKIFQIRQSLEVHMRYHTGTYPFACEFCEKKFAQRGHLNTHLQVKHNNLRYVCRESGCGKVFKNSISLRNHSFVHVGMPFKCVICQKGYPQKSKLKVHISSKHNQEFSLDELESMRKFKDPRIRHSFVRLKIEKDPELLYPIVEFGDDMVGEIEVTH